MYYLLTNTRDWRSGVTEGFTASRLSTLIRFVLRNVFYGVDECGAGAAGGPRHRRAPVSQWEQARRPAQSRLASTTSAVSHQPSIVHISYIW